VIFNIWPPCPHTIFLVQMKAGERTTLHNGIKRASREGKKDGRKDGEKTFKAKSGSCIEEVFTPDDNC
jgi:hypothetical protein